MEDALFRQLMTGNGKVIVAGLGVTGLASAVFLKRCGITVECVEDSSKITYANSKYAARLPELLQLEIPIHFETTGSNLEPLLPGVRLAVLSPGIPLDSPLVQTFQKNHVEIISELELGIQLSGVPVIMVTGSNGKTTTATLIHHLLVQSEVPSLLCGNVGTPLVSTLEPAEVAAGMLGKVRFLVIEASSYQLEACMHIAPKIGVFLNLSDNHLERHGSLEGYFAAKARMVAHQTSNDFVVVNADDEWAKKLASMSDAQAAWYGRSETVADTSIHAKIFSRSGDSARDISVAIQDSKQIFSLEKSALLGAHNQYNAAAALLTALLAGAPAERLQAALNSFAPLEHRLEPVGEIDGLLFINDSKSTTVAASVAGLKAVTDNYSGRSIVLMIGGLAKTGAWAPLMSAIAERGDTIREVVCFGGDAPLLVSECGKHAVHCVSAASLGSGLAVARAVARSGDVVLLSPGCSSFDEFNDFEERGVVFKKLLQS